MGKFKKGEIVRIMIDPDSYGEIKEIDTASYLVRIGTGEVLWFNEEHLEPYEEIDLRASPKIISFMHDSREVDVSKYHKYKYMIPEHEPIHLSDGSWLHTYRVTPYLPDEQEHEDYLRDFEE